MRASASLLFPLLLGACGSAVDSVADGGGGSAPPSQGSTSTGVEAGRSWGLVEAKTYGYVALTEVRGSDVQGSFSLPPLAPLPDECQERTVGACVVSECSVRVIDTIDPDTLRTIVDAGVITLRGGAREVTLTADGAHYPADRSLTDELFAGGETLELDVAGSAVVEPHAASVVAPHRIVLVAPDLDALAGGVPVRRDAPLPVRWRDGVAGDLVEITLFTRDEVEAGATGRAVALGCSADAAAGELTVPAEALSSLAATGDAVTSGLVVETRAVARVAPGSFDVELVARSSAVTVGGALAEARIAVE